MIHNARALSDIAFLFISSPSLNIPVRVRPLIRSYLYRFKVCVSLQHATDAAQFLGCCADAHADRDHAHASGNE